MKVNQEKHKKKIQEFLDYFEKHITGRERAEGQVFLERLFQAFGNAGVLESGAVFEQAIKKRKKNSTAFADLVWPSRVVVELKKRGEKLEKHYDQAFEYWLTLVPHRPAYMILCNFDEFWIYDLNTQLNDPVHRLKTSDLLDEWVALSFLFPSPIKPIFNNNNVEVTEEVAKIVGSLYFSLTERDIEPERAQRFVLQLVVALFSEDVGLIPKYTIYKILEEAIEKPIAQKELIDLFEAMAHEKTSQKPKKYKDIAYFNGGIFKEVEPVELNFKEFDLLFEASKFNWAKVRPSIFGSMFEGSMDPKKRHGHGIHFTSELDIQKIVGPTIVRPFRERINKAKTKKEKKQILKEIYDFKVLDPACGSGNFLYIAFRELRRLEADLLEELGEDPRQMRLSHVSPLNFYGIDINTFAIELAKVALSIGRKMSADELGLVDHGLPFEDLDENFSDKDALLEARWPEVDTIIGNPPFQSKNKMQEEFGRIYLNRIREKYPNISGYADYCVYWFKKSHQHLKRGQRAGLVGTNTIRQNQSREGGLDYITDNEGVITDAVSTQVWSGDAVVHVSIVNWIKGGSEEGRRLAIQKGDSQDSSWEIYELKYISSSLSPRTDVASAQVLKTNMNSALTFQGQTHGHSGFLLSTEQAGEYIGKNKAYAEVLFPYLIGNELVGNLGGKPKRFVIDFKNKTLQQSMKYKELFNIVEKSVLPFREEKVKEERAKNKELLEINPNARLNKHSEVAMKRWWLLRWSKLEMLKAIEKIPRYIACARVTKRQIFEFVDSQIHPNDKVQVFALPDDYSLGIISSEVHWLWFKEKCTTLKGDYNYNAKSVWGTFPWPQKPTKKQVLAIADASRALRVLRTKLMVENKLTLRTLYKSLDYSGENPLQDAHEKLNKLVLAAYGFQSSKDILQSLLDLNLRLYDVESSGGSIQQPGVPPCIKESQSLISEDCIKIEVY